MSRIGKQPILIPDRVEVKLENRNILISGPKGELKQVLPDFVNVEIGDNQLKVSVNDSQIKKQRSSWGTFARLIFNMTIGVTKGFEKKLELVGVGYRAQITDNILKLTIGFSHPVDFLIPKGVEIKLEQNIIVVSGIDKQLVGEVAAQIRRLRKPEPYKGKGIKYSDEVIRKKAGKKAVATGI